MTRGTPTGASVTAQPPTRPYSTDDASNHAVRSNLGSEPEWDFGSLGAAIAAGKERVIPLHQPRPVYVLYWTAWIGEDGHIDFHRDVYHRDPQLALALATPVTPRL